MTSALQKQPQQPNIADIANKRQADASRPDYNIWVGASAGSGKTKVLSDRVLRLLLPDDMRAGADPSKILGITFTKAAASEVLERIMKNLRDWAIMPQPALQTTLDKLLGKKHTQNQLITARALFARVLEVAGGMKIMTIHAFCQSVLARFPMEAGLPAGFKVMDEREARAMMTQVRHALIAKLQTPDADPVLKNAFDELAAAKNTDDLEKLLGTLAGERGRLYALRARHNGTDGLCAAINAYLDIQAGTTADGLVDAFIKKIPADDIRAILPVLENDGQKNQEHFERLSAFLANAPESNFAQYRLVFLTTEKTPRTLKCNAGKNQSVLNLFADEAARLLRLDTALRNLATATATQALVRVALACLDRYEIEKHKANRLDYEDLIERTKKLLGSGGVHWVQYKLDGGIDHILVDEAQDTNPDQWAIVTALYDEFYDGSSAREPAIRTTFVVGDEKQSIFSFQRADPRVFDAMRIRLAERTARAQQKYDNIPMQISFRSAPSILRATDGVFADEAMRKGVTRNTAEGLAHTAFNSGRAGLVEIWPVIARTNAAKKEAWALPELADTTQSPIAALAEKIALKIRDMLDNPAEKIESEGRRIRPGDIMILLRQRKPMADAILKALRRHKIPVGGIDRMVVTKQLAVMDVLSAIAFALQPDDDLNLATLLKSPFIGLDDDALFAFCHTRTGNVWSALKSQPQHAAIVNWLTTLLDISNSNTVATLLHHVLFTPCPMSIHNGMQAMMARLGADIRDPLQELLARADSFDMSDARGLQGFLQDAQNDDSEIKRQLAEEGDCVRMMTVHGSKGLEAPIVFLPDTIRPTGGARMETILWPDRDDASSPPLWAPNADMRADAYKARNTQAKADADEEYKRLLYVALTRAAERLYICGADKYKKGGDTAISWYYRILAAFTGGTLTEVITDEDGTLRIKNAQTDPVKEKPEKHTGAANIAIPHWATTTAPAPAMPPRPLTPSKPEGDEPAAMSPLFGDTSYRFKRGRIIHTLFQFLPELPQNQREARARLWLAQPTHALDAKIQQEILDNVMAVLDDPTFAPLFTGRARAEVPLTGLLGPQSIVSGQIDRLLVTDDTILIIDYKTNRPAPKKREDVPEAYRRQMRTYRDLLARLWPNHTINCALLWTDGPDLMDITSIL